MKSKNKIYEENLKTFEHNNIFKPTLTSKLLINVAKLFLKKKQKILDLGCGGGIISASLFNRNYNQTFHLSDLSINAIKKAKKNLKSFKGKFIFKSGDGFDPWKGNKYDLIINDISGISSAVSKISPWFKNVPIDKSIKGTSLLKKTINKSSNYMNKESIIIFPLISLCDTQDAKRFVKKKLKILKEFNFEWPLPKVMMGNIKLFSKFKKKKYISYKEKYGIIICTTTIVVAKI